MTDDPYDLIDELVEQAEPMDATPLKVQLLEEAARISDSLEDIFLQIELRDLYIDAADEAGMVDKALVAFSWYLGKFDEDPTVFDDPDGILWQYVHLVVRSVDVTYVSLTQIYQLLDDLEARFKAFGYGLRPSFQSRWRTMMRMSRFDEAMESHQVWQDLPRNHMCYDVACETDAECELLVRMGRHEEAIQKAQPILDGKLVSEPVVPGKTFGDILIAAMQLGLDDLAADCHRRGWPHHIDSTGDLFDLSRHLFYFIRIDDLKNAVKTFEENMSWVFCTTNIDNHWHFFCGCDYLLQKLIAKNRRPKLRLPAEHPLHCDSGDYELGELANWFRQQVIEIGDQFDRRNENDGYQELRASYRKMVRL